MPFVYAVEAFSLVRRPLAFTSFRTPIHKRLRLELDFHRERDLKSSLQVKNPPSI